jgi:hypothetical protein
MAQLNTRANLKMKAGATVMFDNVTSFPDSPTIGQICFMEQVLYIYANIGGTATWYPLTNKALYYIHTQETLSTLWQITHNLNSKLVGIFAYDENDELQNTQPSFIDANSLNLSFTEAIRGKAVVFAASDSYAGMGTGTGGGSYTLPIATATALGGVKVGNNLSIGATTGVLDAVDQLDGSYRVTGNILPDGDNTRNLGSATNRFANIYAAEVRVGASSLYVNDKKVIEDVSNTITIKTDIDQDLAVKTTGTGDVNLLSDSTVTTNAKGGVETTVPSNNANKNILFQNQSSGGIISFVASGTSSQVQFTSIGETNFNASTVKFNSPVDFTGKTITGLGDVTITGNLTVSGTTTTVNTTSITAKDNLIEVNSGETGAGVTNGEAGIQVDRGTLTDYKFIFDETKDAFTVGMVNDQQVVATREDSPVNNGVPYFDNSTRKFTTSSNITWTGTKLQVGGNDVLTSATLPTASASVAGVIKIGSGLSIDGSGVVSASGGGGGWTILKKSAAYTAVASDYVIADTTTAGFNFTLPASPSQGDRVCLIDEKGMFATNNIIVIRNGSTIRGVAEDLTVDVAWARVEFIYSGTTWLYSAS